MCSRTAISISCRFMAMNVGISKTSSQPLRSHPSSCSGTTRICTGSPTGTSPRSRPNSGNGSQTRGDIGCEDWEGSVGHHREDNGDVFCKKVSFLLRPSLTKYGGRDLGEIAALLAIVYVFKIY